MDKSKLNCPPGNWDTRSKLPEPKKEEPPKPAPLPQGTAMWREDKISAWNLNAAECSTCLTMVPQSQLSVCTKAACEYALKTGQVLSTPTQFFNAQKRFCGQCTNYRSHCGHREFMKQALPLAISTTSVEAAIELTEKYSTTAHLDQERLLDYVMKSEFDTEDLTIPKFEDYLSSSLTSSEWMAKKELVEKFIRTLEENRVKAMAYVKELAKESVDAYQALLRDTEQDYARKEQVAQDFEFKQKEHTDKMKKSDELSCQPIDIAQLILNNAPSTPRGGSVISEASAHSRISMAPSVRVVTFDEDTSTIRLEEKEQDAVSYRSATPPSEYWDEDGVVEHNDSLDESSESVLLDETRDIADITAIYIPSKQNSNMDQVEISKQCLQLFQDGRDSGSIEDLLASISHFIAGANDDDKVRRAVCKSFKSTTGFTLHPPGSDFSK